MIPYDATNILLSQESRKTDSDVMFLCSVFIECILASISRHAMARTTSCPGLRDHESGVKWEIGLPGVEIERMKITSPDLSK